MVAGFYVSWMVLRYLGKRRIDKFEDQLADNLAILSGSVRGLGEDGTSRHQLEGFVLFDLESNHLSYLSLKGAHALLEGPGAEPALGLSPSRTKIPAELGTWSKERRVSGAVRTRAYAKLWLPGARVSCVRKEMLSSVDPSRATKLLK